MAKWTNNNVVFTNIGKDILARVQAGNGSITVTRVVSGSGRVSVGDLPAQTAVSSIKQELSISKLTTNSGGSSIDVQLSNAGLETGYNLNQIGVYVTHTAYTGEQLYMIAQCDVGEHDAIPLPTESPVTLFYGLYLSFSPTAPVTISPSYSGYATVGELSALTAVVAGKQTPTGDLKDNITTFTQATTRVNLTPGEKVSIALGKIMKFFADLKAVAFSGSYADLTDVPTSLPASGGNSATVNGFTVLSAVPANALFTDTIYVHPTASGSKHIPNGGGVGQVLVYAADGTAQWSNITIPTYSLVTTSSNGLMGSLDKQKLDGIATGANNYSHPTSGVSASTYRSVTVDSQGHVTGGTNPTSLAGYGIDDAAPKTHIGSGGNSHADATNSTAGFMSGPDKTKLNSIETGATADMTPNEIITAVKTVDGSGSGLDADYVDGWGIENIVRKLPVNGMSAANINNAAIAYNYEVPISGDIAVVVGLPNSFWHLKHMYYAPDGYAAQMAICFYGGAETYVRSANGMSFGAWQRLSPSFGTVVPTSLTPGQVYYLYE
jgi:hypothetical protein